MNLYETSSNFGIQVECHQQGISEKRYQHVRLHPFFKLMKQWADGQFTLEGAEGGLHFRQLHILLPKICSTVACQIRTQEISSLSCLQPLLLFRLLPPD